MMSAPKRRRRRTGLANDKRWPHLSRTLRSITDHCVVCLSGDRLVVHHLRYRGRRGAHERPEDLVVLCVECHDALHEHGYTDLAGFNAFRDQMRVLHPLPHTSWLEIA